MKKVILLLLAFLFTTSTKAETPTSIIFETQWQQYCYPVNAAKCQFALEHKLTYSINEQASMGSSAEILKALAAASREAQIKLLPSTYAQATAHLVFEVSRSDLKEIDKFLLKHWNGELITPCINVLRAAQVLGNQWIEAKVPVQEQAKARA